MDVRKVNLEDLPKVSQICLSAFDHSVASGIEEEGINTFKEIASANSLADRMGPDNQMLVCELAGEMVGYAELKHHTHLSMLFVSPEHHCKGVGRTLIKAVIELGKEGILIVSASLPSVPAYKSYGFKLSGEPGISSGLSYQPMELTISNG